MDLVEEVKALRVQNQEQDCFFGKQGDCYVTGFMYVQSVLAPPVDCVEKADSSLNFSSFPIGWVWSHGWSQVRPAILEECLAWQEASVGPLLNLQHLPELSLEEAMFVSRPDIFNVCEWLAMYISYDTWNIHLMVLCL